MDKSPCKEGLLAKETLCRIAISSAQWSMWRIPLSMLSALSHTFWEGRFVDLSVLGYTDFMPIGPVAGEDGVRRAYVPLSPRKLQSCLRYLCQVLRSGDGHQVAGLVDER